MLPLLAGETSAGSPNSSSLDNFFFFEASHLTRQTLLTIVRKLVNRLCMLTTKQASYFSLVYKNFLFLQQQVCILSNTIIIVQVAFNEFWVSL